MITNISSLQSSEGAMPGTSTSSPFLKASNEVSSFPSHPFEYLSTEFDWR